MFDLSDHILVLYCMMLINVFVEYVYPVRDERGHRICSTPLGMILIPALAAVLLYLGAAVLVHIGLFISTL